MQTINRRLKITGLALLLALPHGAAAGSVGGYIDNMAPMRERVQQMEAFWKQKKAEVLPVVMREQGVDCWIVISVTVAARCSTKAAKILRATRWSPGTDRSSFSTTQLSSLELAQFSAAHRRT